MEKPILQGMSGSHEMNNQNSDEKDAITEEHDMYRLAPNIALPRFIKDALFTGLRDHDTNLITKRVLIMLILGFTIIFGLITLGNHGVNHDGNNSLKTSVLFTLSLTQIISVLYVAWLVCSNRKRSNNFQIYTGTPIDTQTHPCFMNLVWEDPNDKHCIKVTFIWIFGFICLIKSVDSIFDICFQTANNDRSVVVAEFIYLFCFIVLILYLQIVFFNFRLKALTISRKCILFILTVAMISIWMYLLFIITLQRVNQTYILIQYLQDLLHPALTSFPLIGIYLIANLFQNEKTNQDGNWDNPCTLMIEIFNTFKTSTRTVEKDKEIDVIDASNTDESCTGTVEKDKEIDVIDASNTDESCTGTVEKDKQGDTTETSNTDDPSSETVGGEGHVNWVEWFWGVLWFLARFIFSLILLPSEDAKIIITYTLYYRCFIMVFYLLLSKGMGRDFNFVRIYRCRESYVFIIMFLALAYFHCMHYTIDIMHLHHKHSLMYIDVALKIIESAVDALFLILWILLQVVFIKETEIVLRKETVDLCSSIKSISTFLGIANFGEWIFLAICALPAASYNLLNNFYCTFNPCLALMIGNLVCILVVTFFIIMWMKMKFTSQKLLNEYSKSESIQKISTV